MSHVLAEVALQRVLQIGLNELRGDQQAFKEIFGFYLSTEMEYDYGQSYIDSIYKWFTETKLPVVQAWSFNPQRIPCISIHLASDSEDEQKAAFSDDFGNGPDGVTGVNTFIVQLDVGIHANLGGDQVMWVYYIVSYVLFKKKLLAENLGLRLQTWTATDWNKDPQYMTDNIYTRWLRYRCSVQNFWEQQPYDGPFDDVSVEAIPSSLSDFEDIE